MSSPNVYEMHPADCIIYINDKCVGELSKLRFDSIKKENQLELDVQLFFYKDNFNIGEFLKNLNSANIKQIFCDEYNPNITYKREYLDVTFKGIKTDIDVYDYFVYDTYVFDCSGVTELEKFNYAKYLLDNAEVAEKEN